jgi:hypothetical protein
MSTDKKVKKVPTAVHHTVAPKKVAPKKAAAPKKAVAPKKAAVAKVEQPEFLDTGLPHITAAIRSIRHNAMDDRLKRALAGQFLKDVDRGVYSTDGIEEGDLEGHIHAELGIK